MSMFSFSYSIAPQNPKTPSESTVQKGSLKI